MSGFLELLKSPQNLGILLSSLASATSGDPKHLQSSLLLQEGFNRNSLLRQRLNDRARRKEAIAAIPGLLSEQTGVQDLSVGDTPAGSVTANLKRPTDATSQQNRQDKVLGLLAEGAPETFAHGLLGNILQPAQRPTNLQREFEFLESMKIPRDEILEMLNKGTSITVGDGKLDLPMSVSDLKNVRLPDGSRPKLGSTVRDVAKAGGIVLDTAQQKALEGAAKFGPVLDRLEELALGEDGVFVGIKPGIGNRIQAGFDLFISSLTRDNPNVSEFKDLGEGTIAPLIRQMGESGALSDGDVARALKILPQIMGDFLLPDTHVDARRKMDILRSILERGEANLRKGIGFDSKPAKPAAAGASSGDQTIDFKDLPGG